MTQTVQEWIEIADYDLQTAAAMFKAKRYLYVIFMCQQAVEKALKGLFVQNKAQLPPRTHNLLYLAEEMSLKLKKQELVLLSYLNQFYLESRYPGQRNQLAKEVHKLKAKEILISTREVIKCLKKNLR